jgi:hypothetical protein
MNRELDRGAILAHYVACALWSSTQCDEEGTNCIPLDDIADIDDCAPETLREFRAECAAFFFHARRLLRPFFARDGRVRTLERAAHDLWLTAQGHGAGFWDGDWRAESVDHGTELSKLAKSFGSHADLYVGDDGRVYA